MKPSRYLTLTHTNPHTTTNANSAHTPEQMKVRARWRKNGFLADDEDIMKKKVTAWHGRYTYTQMYYNINQQC